MGLKLLHALSRVCHCLSESPTSTSKLLLTLHVEANRIRKPWFLSRLSETVSSPFKLQMWNPHNILRQASHLFVFCAVQLCLQSLQPGSCLQPLILKKSVPLLRHTATQQLDLRSSRLQSAVALGSSDDVQGQVNV